MLHLGQAPPDDDDIIDICLDRHRLGDGEAFRWHAHDYHQLTWSPDGVVAVHVEDTTWTLPPTLALWIPAARHHLVSMLRAGDVYTLYFRVERCAHDWDVVILGMGDLLRATVDRLADATIDLAHRSHLETVVFDLLDDQGATPFALPLPDAGPAREVAGALLTDPADARTLGEWGRHVGASERTLSRHFAESSGMTFEHWRRTLRMYVAMGRLAAGEPVGVVAHAVGYRDVSAFIQAFRRATGSTPRWWRAAPLTPHAQRSERAARRGA